LSKPAENVALACLREEQILALLQGSPTPAERTTADQHLDACPRCFDLMANVVQALAEQPGDGPSVLAPSPSPEEVEPAVESVSRILPRGALIQDRYTIVDILGVGSMGIVYAALDESLHRRVALKVVRPEQIDGRDAERAQARLVREARILAKLSHPNVIVVHDVGHTGASVFMAMELVAGQTLREWLEASPRPSLSRILDAFLHAGRGLAAAHAAGVVHRDFKPDNVLVGKDGRIHVTDFGLARSPSTQQAQRTAPSRQASLLPVTVASNTRSSLAGTPRYMAPEQYDGHGADARSDQFAFCFALHEAVYGAPPFPVESEAIRLEAIRSGAVQAPPAGNPATKALRLTLLRGLEANPERRFPSMAALCDALEQTTNLRGRAVSWGAVAGVAALLLWILAASSTHEDPEAICPSADQRLRGVWDEPARASMRGAAAKLDSLAAREAEAHIEATLDGYASTWKKRYDERCQQARTSQGKERQLAAASLFCLEQNLSQVRVLVDAASRADGVTLTYLDEGGLRLHTLDACTDPAGAKMIEPVPTEEPTRSQVLAMRVRLAEASALTAAGRIAEARALELDALEEAEGLDYAPVLAEVLRELGNTEFQAGDLPAARHALKRALSTAETARHDILIPWVWISLARIDASSSRLVEASSDLDRADAYFARVEQTGPRRALLMSQRALVLRALGRHREAIAAEKVVLTLREAEGPSQELRVAGSLAALGSSYEAIGEDTQALDANLRALSIRERRLGPKHLRVAASLNGVGSVLAAQGRLEEAEPRFLRSLSMREELVGPEHLEVSHVLINLGMLEGRLGKYALARAHLERALSTREKTLEPDHVMVLDARVALASLLVSMGSPEAALPMFERARAGFERTLGSAHPATALTLAKIGRAQLSRGAPAAAQAALESALGSLEKAEIRADQQAEAQLDLALAITAGRGDLTRARRLVESAREAYRNEASTHGRELAAIDAWLAKHPLPPARQSLTP
jgi:serine/threonine protein kinase/tetratricopeptide (TPR) repeat protein